MWTPPVRERQERQEPDDAGESVAFGRARQALLCAGLKMSARPTAGGPRARARPGVQEGLRRLPRLRRRSSLCLPNLLAVGEAGA